MLYYKGHGGDMGASYNAVVSPPVFSLEQWDPLPITVAEVKQWCKIELDNTTEDDLVIKPLIRAAIDQCQTYANKSFIQRVVTVSVMNRLGAMNLPYGPIIGGLLIGIFNDAGESGSPYTITGNSFQSQSPGNYTISYQAGYVQLPDTVKFAIKSQIAYIYENRGDDAKTAMLSPVAVAFLRPHRNIE